MDYSQLTGACMFAQGSSQLPGLWGTCGSGVGVSLEGFIP